ncbi:response regulator [Jannaschia donghaensis]|uniref:Virulence transcriptional regulatory protein PhoP n=1 Tax=Jannaschia donghaensis TaxID=420998 RepID=A0A0M6YE32_9RHOB|nr:response regulator [Jannaschia donghaensis]CTQ48240.1 Virulence transcriptional regulatory protein PhoP [Jannaschia donghaensis]
MSDSDFMIRPVPTPQRPLLGQTVLLVEDSRYASEAVRMLALRSGARIRRADCIASAERHLNTYRAEVAIIDLGLPDGCGLDLIARLNRAAQRPTVLIGTSGRDATEVERETLNAGADGFLAKPIESMASFQQAILRHLPPEFWPKGLRVVGSETVEPDRLALSEDLAYAERLLTENRVAPSFVADFLTGLARTGNDAELLDQTQGLAGRTVDDLRPQLQALISQHRQERRVV